MFIRSFFKLSLSLEFPVSNLAINLFTMPKLDMSVPFPVMAVVALLHILDWVKQEHCALESEVIGWREDDMLLRNAEVTNDGSEAFKESVKFIDYRALDPEHELSEAKDTFKDKLENDNNNHNDKGITHPFFQKLIQAKDLYRSRSTWRSVNFSNFL